MVDRPGISTCSRSFARGRCETSASCGLRLDRHDGESPALIAGPGRLDGGVEGEQVGLEGDLVDDADDLGDLAGSLADASRPFWAVRLDSTASSAAWRAWSEFCFTVRRSRRVVRSFWTAAFLLAPGPVFLEQGVAAEVGSREHEGGARTRALDIGREATISEGRQASVWRTILPSIM